MRSALLEILYKVILFFILHPDIANNLDLTNKVYRPEEFVKSGSDCTSLVIYCVNLKNRFKSGGQTGNPGAEIYQTISKV